MSSWSCPYFDEQKDWCRRLKVECVPGRKGCILPKNLRFAVPPEERIIAKKRAGTSRPAGQKPSSKKNLNSHRPES